MKRNLAWLWWLAVLASPGALAQGSVPGPVVRSAAALPLVSIASAQADDNHDTIPDRFGQQVRVRGVVTVPPGVVNSKNFEVIIQDETGGIILYSRSLSVSLRRGDLVEATGTVGRYRGSIQLQRVSVRRLGRAALPVVQSVEFSEPGLRQHLGEWVRVDGVVEGSELGDYATVQLRGPTGMALDLYFPSSVMANLPLGLFRPGARIGAEGVLSIYERGGGDPDSLELIVTRPGRMQLLAPPPPPWRRWVGWMIAAMGVVLVLVVAAAHVLRRRRRERERELDTFNALSTMLEEQGLSRTRLAQIACEAMVGQGLCDALAVYVPGPGGRLHLLGASGIGRGAAIRVGERERLAQWQGEAGSGAGAAGNGDADGPFLLLALPMTAPGRVLGTLAAFCGRDMQATHIQRRTLLAASKLLGLGLANLEISDQAHREQQELTRLATTDDLTSLHNRRYLDAYLEEQVGASVEAARGMAFLLIDLDHFKSVNDRWGHAAGDLALQRVAAEIRDAIRASDVAVRYGGEEFLVVAPDMGLELAQALGERLRARFESLALRDVAPGEVIRFTISIGIAVLPTHGDGADEVLRACDLALYRSKADGRNRVTVAK